MIWDFEQLFDESYNRALASKVDGKGFMERFYERFINASPVVREKFKKTDMHLQQQMLETSIHYLAYLFSSTQVTQHIEQIARIHSRVDHDIPVDLYDLWLDELIETLREFDSEFDDDIELSWRLTLARGIAYMKFKYNHQ